MDHDRPVPPLTSPGWLVEHLDDPGVVVLEVSKHATDEQFRIGHVAGARFANWKALCWHQTDRDFVAPEELACRLGQLGISDDTHVVISGDPIQFGIYAYLTLQMQGHHRVSVLDGGKQHWAAHGLPMETGEAAPVAPVPHRPGPQDQSPRILRDEVRAAIDDPDRVIVDLRTDEEYLGQRVAPSARHPIDHGAERHGRIPGALHLYYEGLLDDDGRFLPPDRLREVYRSAGVEFDRSVITYCRLAHRASLGWFTLSKLIGFDDVRVYDGSWTEWGSIVGMPVERAT